MEDIKVFLGRLNHEKITDEKISQTFCNDKLSTTDNLNLDEEILFKYVGKEILTGEEEWFYSEEKGTYYYNQFNKAIDNENNLKMLSNYFRFSENKILNWGEFQSGDNQEIHFKFDKEQGNLKNFTCWLKTKFAEGIPVEVYFVMQFPNILCRRFMYNSDPRFFKFKGKHFSVVPKDGGLPATIDSDNNLFYETDNIYMRNI